MQLIAALRCFEARRWRLHPENPRTGPGALNPIVTGYLAHGTHVGAGVIQNLGTNKRSGGLGIRGFKAYMEAKLPLRS